MEMEPEFLKKATNEPPFEVPGGYFNELHGKIMDRVRQAERKPALPAAASGPVFQVPEGYFDSLPGRIARRTSAQTQNDRKQAGRVPEIILPEAFPEKRLPLAAAVAACLALLLGIAGVMQVKKLSEPDNFLANIATFDEEILVQEYLEAGLTATETQPSEVETYIMNQVDEGLLIQEL